MKYDLKPISNLHRDTRNMGKLREMDASPLFGIPKGRQKGRSLCIATPQRIHQPPILIYLGSILIYFGSILNYLASILLFSGNHGCVQSPFLRRKPDALLAPNSPWGAPQQPWLLFAASPPWSQAMGAFLTSNHSDFSIKHWDFIDVIWFYPPTVWTFNHPKLRFDHQQLGFKQRTWWFNHHKVLFNHQTCLIYHQELGGTVKHVEPSNRGVNMIWQSWMWGESP